jgi:hypothetical protein
MAHDLAGAQPDTPRCTVAPDLLSGLPSTSTVRRPSAGEPIVDQVALASSGNSGAGDPLYDMQPGCAGLDDLSGDGLMVRPTPCRINSVGGTGYGSGLEGEVPRPVRGAAHA